MSRSHTGTVPIEQRRYRFRRHFFLWHQLGYDDGLNKRPPTSQSVAYVSGWHKAGSDVLHGQMVRALFYLNRSTN